MLHHLWNYISYIGVEDKKELITTIETKTQILFNRAILVGSVALIFHYAFLFPFLEEKAVVYGFISELSILIGYFFIKRKRFYTGARVVIYTVYSLGILALLQTGKDLLGHLAGIALTGFTIVLFRKKKIDIIITIILVLFLIFAGEFEPLNPPDLSRHPFAMYARLASLLNFTFMIILFAWVLSDINEYFERKLVKALLEKNGLVRDISDINLRLKKANTHLQAKTEEIAAQAEELRASNDELMLLNEKLKVQTLKTQTINDILSKRNKQVLDSLLYARRLQEALLPSREEMQALLKKYFVLYQPKDILSGDFYWLQKLSSEDEYLFCVGDATGHGVPGAIVSFLSVHILTSATLELGLTNPSEILSYAKKEMCKMFASDGMDIALCLRKKNTIFFAGAYNPLIILRNNEILEFPGTKQRVGECKKQEKFRSYEINIQKDDMIYLFSDGIIDQFGGKKNRKLGLKNFKKVLLKIHREEITHQKQQLENFIKNWMGKNPQVDDICVLGIKAD